MANNNNGRAQSVRVMPQRANSQGVPASVGQPPLGTFHHTSSSPDLSNPNNGGAALTRPPNAIEAQVYKLFANNVSNICCCLKCIMYNHLLIFFLTTTIAVKHLLGCLLYYLSSSNECYNS